MESTNLSKSNYVSSYDSKVARLGQGVQGSTSNFHKDLVRLLNVSRLQ